MPDQPDSSAVRDYLFDLQDRICSTFAREDGGAGFREDAWERSPSTSTV